MSYIYPFHTILHITFIKNLLEYTLNMYFRRRILYPTSLSSQGLLTLLFFLLKEEERKEKRKEKNFVNLINISLIKNLTTIIYSFIFHFLFYKVYFGGGATYLIIVNVFLHLLLCISFLPLMHIVQP